MTLTILTFKLSSEAKLFDLSSERTFLTFQVSEPFNNGAIISVMDLVLQQPVDYIQPLDAVDVRIVKVGGEEIFWEGVADSF